MHCYLCVSSGLSYIVPDFAYNVMFKYFRPAVNPPKEIVDPNDSKPADWDEREK